MNQNGLISIMHDRNFLYIALLGFGLYWLLKSSPKAIYEDDYVVAEATSHISSTEAKPSKFEIDILVSSKNDNRPIVQKIKSPLESKRNPASKASITQSMVQAKSLGAVKEYIEIFSGLDTRPWLYSLRPGDMEGKIGVICNKCGKDHSADLFTRLIDLQENDRIYLEESNSTAFIVNAIYERSKSISFVKGDVPRATETSLSLIDTPTCKINLSARELPTYQVTVNSFTVGKTEPFKISSKISGVRIYRKSFGQKPDIYRGIESIECSVASAKDNDEKYLQLNMRHLAATLGTNARWYGAKSKTGDFKH